MNKKYIDTNIILRYLLGDKESEFIEKILNGKQALIIPDIVIAEVVWTLGRFYKWPKEKVTQFLFVLLKGKNIEFNEKIIFPALSTFLKYNIRYTDAYISVVMKQSKTKDIYSFDRDFDKIQEVNRLEPK